ncbi:hypothetical protein HK098_006668 [Nowakowskiella sp. JEL0407]|nr:hypothetical protein HK098_006668 [Nowakowskiella sp. JEL0407]
MKIFCRLGDSCFPVDAEPTTTTVGDLKDAIKMKKVHDLSEIDADKLLLVHVFETPSKNEDDGVPVVGVQDDTDLVEVERAVLSKRSSGVDVEKVRKTEDGTMQYKVRGWEINGTTISAKVMNPGGACSDYGLERDSAKFTIDILVIVPLVQHPDLPADPFSLESSKIIDLEHAAFWEAIRSKAVEETSFMPNLIEPVEFLQLGQAHLFGSRKEENVLYIRRCYKDFVRIIMDSIQSTLGWIISGTPGIGKSSFGMYLLRRIACTDEDAIIFWETDAGTLCYAKEGVYNITVSSYVEYLEGRVRLEHGSLSNEKLSRVFSKIWYFSDGVAPKLRPIKAYSVKTILFNSNNSREWKDLNKLPEVSLLYMPVWTAEEMVALYNLSYSHYDPKEIAMSHWFFGGIPRTVFRKFEQRNILFDLLSSAISSVDCKMVLHAVGTPGMLDEKVNSSDCVLHLQTLNPNYTQPIYVFSSPYVESEILRTLLTPERLGAQLFDDGFA